MLTFDHFWMLALAPLPIVVRWLIPPRARASAAVRVPFLPRLAVAAGASSVAGQPSNVSLWVSGTVWLLILIALARPQWLEPPIERTIPIRDLLLLVDLSGSMEQKDFTNTTGQAVTRLAAAKEVLGEFLSQREGDRVGLVVFGNAPFLQVPFTADLDLCLELLDQIEVRMAGPRTALGDAIGLGVQLFENSDAPTKTMIALTDGNDTGSLIPPAEAARVAQDRDITIHTVAIGDPTTVGEEKLDQQAMQDVAEETGGDFFLALNRKELATIYQRLDEIETRDVKTVSYRPRQDLYYWPLACALLVSLAAHAWKILAEQVRGAQPSATRRLRVNTRTFELETVEQ
ncbi:VWA domain-containing protein [Planctomycetaceae bacterium SH139]